MSIRFIFIISVFDYINTGIISGLRFILHAQGFVFLAKIKLKTNKVEILVKFLMCCGLVTVRKLNIE